MQWEKLQEPWLWLIDHLGRPGVLRTFLLLFAVAAIAVWLVSLVVRWLVNHHFEEATSHLLAKYDRRYRFQGIRHEPLKLIAKCIAWVCGLKIAAELIEPFAKALAPGVSERQFVMTRYDWVILSALLILVVKFWWRFHVDVRAHDAKMAPTSRIKRSAWRTLPLFWKPAIALLFLLFLPDLGKWMATAAADYVRESGVANGAQETSVRTVQFERQYAKGLRLTLAPSSGMDKEEEQ